MMQPWDDEGESRDRCQRSTSRGASRTRGDGGACSADSEHSDQRLLRMANGGAAPGRTTSNVTETATPTWRCSRKRRKREENGRRKKLCY
ncbi:hypothetical protein Syun_029591 [Stephania yunnanensis]|uniref:Uncharacterized protein n=1 Tax=Stephania yunnanensis TaxID=152371 RepID=A0AAP0EAB0_9MAGN